MTSSKNPQQPIAPVRRRGGLTGQPAAEPVYEDPEIARGQADAVLGALGRMQLRIDVLTREQNEAFDRIFHALDRLNSRLDAYEEFAEAEEEQAAEAYAALESTVSPPAPPVEEAPHVETSPAPVERPDFFSKPVTYPSS